MEHLVGNAHLSVIYPVKADTDQYHRDEPRKGSETPRSTEAPHLMRGWQTLGGARRIWVVGNPRWFRRADHPSAQCHAPSRRGVEVFGQPGPQRDDHPSRLRGKTEPGVQKGRYTHEEALVAVPSGFFHVLRGSSKVKDVPLPSVLRKEIFPLSCSVSMREI